MFRRLIVFSCLALLGLSVEKAVAAPVLSALDLMPGGGINHISDRDGEAAFRFNSVTRQYDQLGTPGTPGNPTTLQAGDLLLAVAKYDTIFGPGGFQKGIDVGNVGGFDALTAISLIQIQSPIVADGDFGSPTHTPRNDFTFGAAAASDWAILTSQLTSGTTVLTPNAIGTMFMTFDATQFLFDPKNTASTISSDLASASNGSLLWEGGLTSPVNNNEQWTAIAPTDLNAFATDPKARSGSSADYGVSVTYANPATTAGILLQPTSDGTFTHGDSTGSLGGATQFQSNVTFLGTAQFAGTAGNWSLATHSDVWIDPVAPEPSTLLLWGAGLAGALLSRSRRGRMR